MKLVGMRGTLTAWTFDGSHSVKIASHDLLLNILVVCAILLVGLDWNIIPQVIGMLMVYNNP